MSVALGASTQPKSLQRRLFVSHLSVMVVALGVLAFGFAVVVGLFELVDGRETFGREDGGPLGLIVGLGAAVLASAVVSWRVSRRLVAPLDEIAATTRELAGGRYAVRSSGADTRELDQLANDVNQLAQQLETTEQRRLRLIGDVAHELRNPLSTIEGTMEALLDGLVEAEPNTYARIGRESARLRRLADDLSSLSSAGELSVELTDRVEVSNLVATVIAHLEPQAVAKGLNLRLTTEPTPPVAGNTDRLTQVLTNVIGNAIQYTDEGAVDVRVFRDDAIVVEVKDTGRGLAVDDLSRIFERFHRVDRDFSDGTGVGLAIAKLLVEAHDGRIVANSEGPQSGSTFRIEIPAG